ncbi:transposase [Thiotrichales bacterium 19X7-9]|nr:transposase [Thiotrichales bacterium 19X7-9]
MAKKQYKPKNWSSYNRSKIKAGNIFLNISEDINDWWYDKAIEISNTGRPKRYSDRAIEFILTIRYLFKTKLRQTQGFIEGLFSQMGLALNIPDYTTWACCIIQIVCQTLPILGFLHKPVSI